MADIWELITAHSTLGPGHDIWEHLNAQTGGGISIGGLEIVMSDCEFEIEVESRFEIEVESGFEIEVEPAKFEIEVCGD